MGPRLNLTFRVIRVNEAEKRKESAKKKQKKSKKTTKKD
jgi:hypothetical protein